MTIKNKVQLITYPDSLGGSLKGLEQVLDRFFPGLFEGGIHILPPFPSSGDRGFAPLTYFEIDPALGSWEDIRRLGDRYDLLLDLMVNHISSRSPFFQDFLANGRASEWADLFITLEKSEQHYTPTTLYDDYPLSPTRFHWESQSTCHEETPTGRRYISATSGAKPQWPDTAAMERFAAGQAFASSQA